VCILTILTLKGEGIYVESNPLLINSLILLPCINDTLMYSHVASLLTMIVPGNELRLFDFSA
jgi:hypothetical protein